MALLWQWLGQSIAYRVEVQDIAIGASSFATVPVGQRLASSASLEMASCWLGASGYPSELPTPAGIPA